MIKINSIEDLTTYENMIPEIVLVDVKKRISDWLEMEDTSTNDYYVQRNFKYVESCIRRCKQK